jgi:DNA-binding transcriptional LysR family regulator
MSKLPDLEGLAIFAKVVETRSFAAAATELKLSNATVSKAISRVEAKLKTRLFNRTSRRIALTQAGRQLSDRAARILVEGEALEDEALARSSAVRGLVRLAAPMSFGVLHLAALLPEFLAEYPEVSIDLHLSDATVDMVGDGFDAAIRIAVLPGSSLIARRLCGISRYLVGSPSYLKKHGRPRHPLHLAEHVCITYGHGMVAETWRFTHKNGKSATVRPSGPLRINNGDAMIPALIAGVGLGAVPEFILRDALDAGRLERLLTDWSLPSAAVYWVTPPGGLRPKRVDVLSDFVAQSLRSRRRGGLIDSARTPEAGAGRPTR